MEVSLLLDSGIGVRVAHRRENASRAAVRTAAMGHGNVVDENEIAGLPTEHHGLGVVRGAELLDYLGLDRRAVAVERVVRKLHVAPLLEKLLAQVGQQTAHR